MIELALSIVVAIILTYTAASAFKSAKAAEVAALAAKDAAEAAKQSAAAAEGMLALEASREEEKWVEKLKGAFPDAKQVTVVLKTLPRPLKSRWKQLVEAAAMLNPNVRPKWEQGQFQKCEQGWAEAASDDQNEQKEIEE